MLGHVKGEQNREVLLNYLRQANETAYVALQMGANDSDTFTWCAKEQQLYSTSDALNHQYHSAVEAFHPMPSICRAAIIDGELGDYNSDKRVSLAASYRLKVLLIPTYLR